MTKIKKISVGVLLAIVLAWCFTWIFSDDTSVQYRTDAVTRGNIADVITANGTINPVELVSIGTQVSGQVSKMHVKVNDRVAKGQLLAEIDPSVLLTQLKQDQSALETAKSSFAQAQRDLARQRMLVAKDFVAKVDLERAQQSFLQAKNSYESAKTVVERDMVNLSYTKITSPIDGVIISQDVTMGQTLASTYQTPNLFKIAGDLSQMKIDVSLSESDITRVKTGMPVTFTVTAFPDRKFSGKVDTVNLSPNTQQAVVMYNVNVIADNTDSVLLPGMTAYVSMIISEKKDVLRVAASALRFKPPVKPLSALEKLFPATRITKTANVDSSNDDTKTIYVLKDNEPVPVQITIGATDDVYVEISGSSIVEGDKVITGIQVNR
jgi:HlyD family secretion protein